MDEELTQLCSKLVSLCYAKQGADSLQGWRNKFKELLEKKKLPAIGWDDLSIEHLLHQVAYMDSNNFHGNVGVGEREARIASSLVARRHYFLGHGIGRSGDIAEVQPKAAGSSLIYKLTNSLALDAIRLAGIRSASACLVIPTATGMALVLTLLSFKGQRPGAKYVLWPRIDQKSCFKSILTAGLQPVVIENKREGDELTTDVGKIREQIQELGAENVLCVMTTTSCFAPRVPDRLEEVAMLCSEHNIFHLVNNAYGIQSSKCTHLIEQAHKVGRVDAFVQSTDKNFMVPVGGSIVAGFDNDTVNRIGRTYPGRASGSPILDVFITLLSLGENGYRSLLQERKDVYQYLSTNLEKVANSHGERLMATKHNPISLAITLERIGNASQEELEKELTEFGSMLFKRNVSGTRVITSLGKKNIAGYTFQGWGSHANDYPYPYLTAAAALGMTTKDVDTFVKRLDKVFTKHKARFLREISHSQP